MCLKVIHKELHLPKYTNTDVYTFFRVLPQETPHIYVSNTGGRQQFRDIFGRQNFSTMWEMV